MQKYSPGDTTLLLDVMVGKLATYLRMCGYDAAYALDRNLEADDRLLELACEEGRVLVTRDAALARRANERGVLLESRDVTDQLAELVAVGFELKLGEPARCSNCNGKLVEFRGESTPDYAPSVSDQRVWRCVDCGQHFWKGSHWASVEQMLGEI